MQLLWTKLQAAQFTGGAQGALPQLSPERQHGGRGAGHESPWWVETAFTIFILLSTALVVCCGVNSSVYPSARRWNRTLFTAILDHINFAWDYILENLKRVELWDTLQTSYTEFL